MQASDEITILKTRIERLELLLMKVIRREPMGILDMELEAELNESRVIWTEGDTFCARHSRLSDHPPNTTY